MQRLPGIKKEPSQGAVSTAAPVAARLALTVESLLAVANLRSEGAKEMASMPSRCPASCFTSSRLGFQYRKHPCSQ